MQCPEFSIYEYGNQFKITFVAIIEFHYSPDDPAPPSEIYFKFMTDDTGSVGVEIYRR